MMGDVDPFYLTKLSNTPTQGQKWYKKMRIGENQLGKTVKNMIAGTPLDKDERKLTNTSGLKMLVQKLQEAGVSETEIIKVTGHKDTRSLKCYSELSTDQHMKMSKILQNPKNAHQVSSLKDQGASIVALSHQRCQSQGIKGLMQFTSQHPKCQYTMKPLV